MKSFCNKRIKYSTWGDFPVPPTERFPTEITGKGKGFEDMIPQSKNLFLSRTINPYRKENGSNMIRRIFTA